MPRIFYILLPLILMCGLLHAQRLEDITSITFTKQSRGYLNEIAITSDSVKTFIENHRAPENSRRMAKRISQDEWASLILALKDVELKEIDGLQSPTMDRAHDGAMHSSIVLTFTGCPPISHSFDDETPHKELQPLMEAIRQVGGVQE